MMITYQLPIKKAQHAAMLSGSVSEDITTASSAYVGKNPSVYLYYMFGNA